MLNHPNVFGREIVHSGFLHVSAGNVLGQAELTNWGKAIAQDLRWSGRVPLVENSWTALLAWRDGL